MADPKVDGRRNPITCSVAQIDLQFADQPRPAAMRPHSGHSDDLGKIPIAATWYSARWCDL